MRLAFIFLIRIRNIRLSWAFMQEFFAETTITRLFSEHFPSTSFALKINLQLSLYDFCICTRFFGNILGLELDPNNLQERTIAHGNVFKRDSFIRYLLAHTDPKQLRDRKRTHKASKERPPPEPRGPTSQIRRNFFFLPAIMQTFIEFITNFFGKTT